MLTEANWQAQNEAELHARLAAVRAMRNGTIYTEPSGIHFHVITKQTAELRFWLVEQNNPSTGVIQSEIDLDNPLALVEPYTRAMLMSLLWMPHPSRIYLPGLGGGRLMTTLHHYCSQATLYATEIDPGILTVARRFFGLSQDERIHLAIADGRVWLEETELTFDLIGVDVFLDNGYSPYRLNTVEFYELCRSRLQPGGLVAVNLLADDPDLERRLASIAAAFPHVWYYRLPPGESAHDNMVAYASEQPMLDTVTLHQRATELAATQRFTFAIADEIRALHPYTPTAISTNAVEPLYDATPPATYFDVLPSFNTAFSRVQPDWPCPCGSGKRFDTCHGTGA